jgi:predicted PurR-regulated permease PerM
MSASHLPSKEQTITISVKTILTVLFIVLGIGFLWYVREVIAMLLAALLLAALIEPFATSLAKRNIPRGLAVLIVYVFLGAIVTFVMMLLIPVVVDQILQLLSHLQTNYQDIAKAFGQFQSVLAEHGFEQNFKAFLASTQDSINTQVAHLFSTVTGLFVSIGAIFIIMVLTYYMVIEEASAKKYFKSFLPEQYQPFLAQLFSKMQKKIGAWLRGQLILGLIVGTVVYIGLSFLGVNYALLLAIIAGLLEIVPFVGPVIATVPAVIVAFVQHPIKGFFVLVLFLVVQQLENNILVPKVMQKVTGLNPIVSIVALLIGIKLGGGGGETFSFVGATIGAILSIPIATMLAVLLEELFKQNSHS